MSCGTRHLLLSFCSRAAPFKPYPASCIQHSRKTILGCMAVVKLYNSALLPLIFAATHAGQPLPLGNWGKEHSGATGTESSWLKFLQRLSTKMGSNRVKQDFSTTMPCPKWCSQASAGCSMGASVLENGKPVAVTLYMLKQVSILYFQNQK